MRVLLIGDVVGQPGRRALSALLPGLRRELALDVVVANGENVAAGRGLTNRTARELFGAGVDVISSGNHIWDQRRSSRSSTTRCRSSGRRSIRPARRAAG